MEFEIREAVISDAEAIYILNRDRRKSKEFGYVQKKWFGIYFS